MEIKTYRDLIVWQQSMDLVKKTYQATSSFPNNEMYGLTSQIRRSAVSIPSNIAEGYSRKTNDYARFLTISIGSLFELQTQIDIAQSLAYIRREDRDKLYEQTREIERMLVSLEKKVRS